ncbi:11050_t:CDS:2 [Ambispora gerdemannii]|uniref:11050_t:CDS:1 n=1 Tax=Ambispora gerdemannii TaxID=144530 RepID=A0A9N9AIP4_9GLOM|nr:11050_t:CDS:2 [Ambispora gerdemannii]
MLSFVHHTFRFVKRTALKFLADQVPERSLEPQILRILKLLSTYVIYLACFGYLIYLALGIQHENPNVEIKTVEAQNIPAPLFNISSPFNFTMHCEFYNKLGQIVAHNGSECSQFLQQAQRDNQTLHYIGYWNNPSIEMNDTGIFTISLKVFVDRLDLRSAKLDERGPAIYSSMLISFSDAETEQINFEPAKAESVEAKREAIKLGNTYILSPKNQYLLWFWRLQKKDLDVSEWGNRVGFETKTNDYYMIETLMQNADPINISNFSPFASVDILYQTRIIEIDGQTKQNTVLSLLSGIGGAYGLFIAVYCFCFGAQQIGPWGWIYECYGVRRRLKNRINEKFKHHFPLVEIKYPDEKNNEDITQENIHRRLNDLEWQNALLQLMIREYVVDIGNLEDLKRIPTRNSTGV